jgi:hypothetical protein
MKSIQTRNKGEAMGPFFPGAVNWDEKNLKFYKYLIPLYSYLLHAWNNLTFYDFTYIFIITWFSLNIFAMNKYNERN